MEYPRMHVLHPSLNGKAEPFNRPFFDLEALFRLQPDPAPPSRPQPSPKPEQPELPFGPALPPQPEKPVRRSRSAAHARRIEGLAAFCGRSPVWARQIEKQLEATGIFGIDLIHWALRARGLVAAEHQREHDRELTRRFNRAPRHVREQLVQLID
jgi:hypothetical protein